ncbi:MULTISPECIES: putative T7SS-secreted protein [unclassified Streptomyces]|uniref:putative T7SS-secreted protein n=1 Tax=unclassified Streptomyces TaxID=2593676 RepID=UPI0011B079E4|nr:MULTISPECIES: hypothetical protein [unclassified Streptomyces]
MRARDWVPLTDDGKDPVPGDWEEVKFAAQQYRGMADLIRRCSDTLDSVDEESATWTGNSAKVFREMATDLGDRVGKAHGRYDATAEALEEYWPKLEAAQEDSEELRKQAAGHQETLDTYLPLASAAEDEDSESHDRLGEYEEQCETAASCISALRVQLAEVVAAKNAAARKAAEAINDFIKNDGLKNSSGFWKGFRDVLGAIGTAAGKIGAAAGLLALALGWIPFIGQTLGGLLAVVAIAGTALSLIGNMANGNWKGAAFDTLGLVLPGVGRAVGKMATAAGKSAKLQGYTNVLRQGKGNLNRSARIKNAEAAMGGNRTQLRRSASDAANAAPSGVSSVARETVKGIGDQFARRGGGPSLTGMRGRAGDVVPLARSGQYALAASTTAAHGGYAMTHAAGGLLAGNTLQEWV